MLQKEARLESVAKRLRGAYETGPIAPLRDVLGPNDAADAYAVQDINLHVWTGSGRRPTGYKIGLTSAAVQVQLGVDQPNHGTLFADMVTEDGAEIPLAAGLWQPRAEAEVALVLGRDIRALDASVQDVLRATAYATAAIEIVDSRIADWTVSFADMVADNGFAARYVLSPAARSLSDLDLLTAGMVMHVNGRLSSFGVGAACLGHPLQSAAWLARALAQGGRPLVAGDVILTGALGPMIAVRPGDAVQVSIGGLGTVRVRFEDAAAAP